jgi:hypothetical protein
MSLRAFLIAAALPASLWVGLWIAMRWDLRCFYLPWHHIITRWRLTEQSEKLTCSCGRAYGINHDARVVLPWDSVHELYEGPNSILRSPPEGRRP